MNSENFEIIADHTKDVRKFNITGRTVVFKLKDLPINNMDPLQWIKNGIEAVVSHAVSDVDPDSIMGMTFTSDNFNEKGPAWLSFRKAESLTFDDVWGILEKIYQSNSAGLALDTFRIAVTSVSLPRGTGGHRVKPGTYATFEEECKKRHGIVVIENKDNLCLPRALIVAIAHVEKSKNYEKLRLNKEKTQDIAVNELMALSQISIGTSGAGIPELQRFQEYFKEYQIAVYDYVTKGRGVIFKGPPTKKTINLLYHNGHYNVITSLTSTFSCSYYCIVCHVPYNTKNKHRCAASCPCCQQMPPCAKVAEIACDACNRLFRGSVCFENHKKMCNTVKRCADCLRTYKVDERKHVCGEVYCKVCKKFVESGHHCFMQVDNGKPTTNVLFIFYDLETRQETPEAAKVHEPNLCVFMQRCSFCYKHIDNIVCKKCGARKQVLKGNSCVKSLLYHGLVMRKKFNKVVCIAHNSQGFDAQFILKEVIENTDLTPELIMRGSKILLMALNNLSFIDSLNYFPMALAKLPKAFDLGPEIKKGYFPHLFNTAANENYVGPMPALPYYGCDTMRTDDREKFLEWHEQHKDDCFDLQKELIDYCISDVDILMKACIKFRDMFLKECSVCPFTEAVTVASACNKTFRRKFLEPNTIGLIPRGGYRLRDTQSEIALKWLLCQEKERNIKIWHAAKGRETVVQGVRVDGYCKETKQVFEFHGCYYHGHPMCLPSNRDNPLHEDPTDTLNSRYERTVAKTERLRKFGYDVVETWECAFRRHLQQHSDLRNYVDTHTVLSKAPLNPRDALYGGRTGNTQLYYKAQDDERIKYADFCSLYPYICVRGKFPVGHPEIYVAEECNDLNIHEIDGLIKCTILPPQNLYHPVLPIKMHNKLMFLLCRLCGEEQSKECTHDRKVDRAISGTWVMDEVKKALDVGYKMLQVHEIWKYDVIQYDPINKIEGLFSPLMKKFIKLKQEASGWPSWCLSENDRLKYINEFLDSEDVQLEYGHIVKNPGLRSLAKLILNSFWGKFGQRENQSKTSIIRQPAELYTMLTNPCITVNYLQDVNDDVMVVNWGFKEEAGDSLNTVNVAIAAYVTAQARLKLYSELERLGERVLYYDTDSVIYISRDGVYEPQLGSLIGQLTDELECYGAGSYITEFVSGGPKNYAYKVLSPTTDKEYVTCKVKGITLNYDASQKINFESMRKMVLEDSPPVYITSKNIRRTQNFDVVTKEETKIYRINFAKRKREGDYDSLPFGYKRLRTTFSIYNL